MSYTKGFVTHANHNVLRRALAATPVAIAVATALGMGAVPTVAAEAAAGELQEIIVTAQYREENLQSTPLAITALSVDDLEARSFTNLDDVGAAIPNAYFRQPVSNFGPTQTVGLRGLIQVDFNYAFEPTVGIYIDDVYHGTLTGSSMDLTDLERIEVLRGPQGTLFGKNSMGGAVRLISKKPQGDGTGSIEVTYGERHRVDVRAVGDFSLIDDKLFARVVGVSRRRDGYGEHLDFTCEMIRRGTPQLAGRGDGLGAGPTTGSAPVAVPVNSPADNNFSFPLTIDPSNGNGCSLGDLGGSESAGARAMLRLLATDRMEINVAGEYSSQTSDPPVETMLTRRSDLPYENSTIYPKWGIRIDDRWITGNPYSNYATYGNAVAGTHYDPNTHLSTYGVSGTLEYKLTDKMQLKLISAYRQYETTWVNDSDLTPFELIQTNYLQQHHQFQGEAQLTGLSLADRLAWTAGVFYYDSASRAYNTADFVTFNLKFVADDLFTSENQSAFLHGNYKLTDRFSVSGGLRYSNEDKFNNLRHPPFVPSVEKSFGDSRVDYSAGLDFQLTDNLFVYGQTSTGFQSAGITPRVFTVGQVQDLPGEEVTNYEVGAKLELFDKRVRINSAVFYMDYSKRLIQPGGTTQCNLATDPNPGEPFFLAGGLCPAGTPAAGTAGSPWFFYQNAPGIVQGFESEITAYPIENLALNASVGFNEFDGDAPRPIPGQPRESDRAFRDPSAPLQPEWNLSAGAQYGIGLGNFGRLTPRLDWFYQSHRTNGTASLPQREPDDIVPSYGIYNARLTYETADKSWEASFSIQNLTDKFYWQQLGTATQRGGINNGLPSVARVGTPGRPREWAVTVKKNF